MSDSVAFTVLLIVALVLGWPLWAIVVTVALLLFTIGAELGS